MYNQTKSSVLKWVFLFFFGVFAVFLFPKVAYAGTVAPSGEQYSNTDYDAIYAELQETGSVTLESGGTYYLSKRIMLESNWTIDATDATIITSGMIFNHDVTSKKYDSIFGVTIKGGTWKTTITDGYGKTLMHFTHAKNITLQDMKIEACNYGGHSIELVACKDVTIDHCKITPLGKPSATSVEEQIQIDIAAPATAPFLSSDYTNGLCCKNITITDCTVTGCRAICANYAATDGGKYLKNFHENIVIKNCKLTGKTAEALALFNTTSATVSGNKIKTKAPTSRDSYSVGCHFAYFGKVPASIKNTKIKITKNKIYGGRQALLVYSHSSSKYGTVTIKNNTLYCKKGAANALKAPTTCIKKLKMSKNKTKSW